MSRVQSERLKIRPKAPATMEYSDASGNLIWQLGILFLYIGMFFSHPTPAHAQQAEQAEWRDGKFFTESDRKEIPTLAKIMGVQNPTRVYHGEYLPSLCPYAMVESTYSESGHLRTYLQLIVHRNNWKCARRERAKSKRVGKWFANSTDLETRREWKVEENEWVKYVPFGDGVSYEDAELILLAIKHSQLVNRLPDNTVPLQIPTIDPMDITSIQVKTNASRTFEIRSSQGGSGEIYVVRINGLIVELLAIQIWIA